MVVVIMVIIEIGMKENGPRRRRSIGLCSLRKERQVSGTNFCNLYCCLKNNKLFNCTSRTTRDGLRIVASHTSPG